MSISSSHPPIIIGGTGGSGTRVVAELLKNAGVYMGGHLNHANDAMELEETLDRFISPILSHTHSLDYGQDDVPLRLWQQALQSLRQSIDAHRKGHEDGLWGAKNPRDMYLLPLFHTLYPNMRFVHVVRDGRDMAFSQNQQQVNKHYMALFGRMPIDWPMASIRQWGTANNEAQQWAKRMLGDHYHLVQFEALCASPDKQSQALYSALGLTEQVETEIESPRSIGRWKDAQYPHLAALQQMAHDSLERFGYAA